MIGPNTFACGTSMPQGEVASTKKNIAPVSFTVRRTSDRGSLPAGDLEATDSREIGRSGEERFGRITDGAACDPDARSWECDMAQITLAFGIHPQHYAAAVHRLEAMT